MSYYDDVTKQVTSLTKTKEILLAHRGMGNTRKVVNDLISKLENVIAQLIDLDPNGDAECLEAKKKLHEIETMERMNHDPFHTIIDIDTFVIPKILECLKIYKNLVEEKKQPVV